jgi:hypothetical protein
MRIAVAILSRGHPDALTGVIMGLWRLRTEQHEIDFRIAVDEDDEDTLECSQWLREIPSRHREWHIGPRPTTRGEVENSVLSFCNAVDVVTLMTDRTFCITPGWDEAIAKAVTEKPNRALWWSCPSDNVCAIPIIPKQWLEACDYKWSPEIFPFWWDDTWNQHIDLLIHGMPSLKVKTSYAGQRGKTTRGREFGFWLQVFLDTLPLRVQAAKEMAPKLGVEFKERADVMLYLQKYADNMRAGIDQIEKTFGDPSDPGPEYFIAKRRAEAMLEEMKSIREAAQ